MTTVRDARTDYFARAGFAPDGGYGDRWVRLKAHGRGYDTSWAGAAEIGAWELASGCGRHYPAWLLNLGAVAIGALLWPRRVLAAFRRGRRSGNLYAGEFREELLDVEVEELRRRLRL